MSKFNIGDKVRCVHAEDYYWYDVGDVLTIKSKPKYQLAEGDCAYQVTYQVEEKDIYAYIGQDDFELVKEEISVKEFDLHQDKWFIRTPTPEISEAVQLWLFEQGISWEYKPNKVKNICMAYITNVEYPDNKKDFLKFGSNPQSPDNNAKKYGHKEIKLSFKTVVDTVEYPEPEVIETPSQKELRILKEQIAQLTQQANKLETTLKGEV